MTYAPSSQTEAMPETPARASGASSLAEIRRQARLLDQMASMQSTLRDWDRFLGMVLTCGILIASLVGVAFAFAPADTEIRILGIAAMRSTWLGWLAVTTFGLTLLLLALDPLGASRRREAAAEALASATDHYRTEPTEAEAAAACERLSEIYRKVMADNPKVPNVLFNPLKAAHIKKIEISKFISRHPGTGYWTARRAVQKAARSSRQADQPAAQ